MKPKTGILAHVFIILSSLTIIAKTEFYTAIVDLESLLHTERELAKTLDKYIQIEEKRLEQVKWLSREYEKMYKSAIGNVESFLSNPLNAYLLVKRLTADWKAAGRLIDESYSRALIENVTNQALIFPDEKDLNGAATALIRLQSTYLLDTKKLAKGEIEGTVISSQLSAGDCFELGSQAFMDEEYDFCVLWLQEALNRLEGEGIKTVDKLEVLEKLSFAYFMLQNIQEAIKYTREIIKEDPQNFDAYQNLDYYENYLDEIEKGKFGDRGTEENELPNMKYLKKTLRRFDDYAKLCRGEEIQSGVNKNKLHCRYTSRNNTYLLLQPVKEEELSIEPSIVMYHDVISDKIVEVIKRLAQPKLTRATVHNAQTGHLEAVDYRISKSAWLDEWEDLAVERANRRIAEITGLSIDTGELLHVINYGIGGHYEPHYDFRRDGEIDGFEKHGTGNRIATWIYYLSDVDAGGSTVFPSLGVQVKPKKGSAAFWYNLKRYGGGDYNMNHAACPVLAGSKWIANKWLHERDQEFRRPCSLNRFE